MPLFPLLAPVQLHAYGSALFLFASLCGSSRAQTNPPAELAFTRIFHGWTNYSTAFLATHDTVSATDFATVASFYTPSCDVAPVEYAAVFIWHGPTNQSVDFAHYDTQVYFWNSFAAFTNAPRQGDLATFTFSAPTGGNTNLPDAITVAGRPAWLLRFALTNDALILTNHHTYLVGIAARTDSAQFGDLFIPTARSSGLSDVQAGNTIIGGWRYVVDAGGLTTYCGQLATELAVRTLVAPPRLELFLAHGVLEISWPASAGCYLLESTTQINSLHSAPGWTTVSDVPLVIDGRNTVTLLPSQAAQWFRLRK